jgi:hypothetical protein
MGSAEGLFRGIIQSIIPRTIKLRRVVKEAWEAVGADEVLALVREMPARCEAGIGAQGGYTKY